MSDDMTGLPPDIEQAEEDIKGCVRLGFWCAGIILLLTIAYVAL